jgi:hypothetical protein
MRSRAIVFVGLVLVAVPLLAEAPRRARESHRHRRSSPPVRPVEPEGPLDRIGQPRTF